MKTWYVAENGIGDGSAADKASGDLQGIQAKCGAGDTLLLKGRIVTHTWPAINRKGCHGMRVAPFDSSRATLVYDGADAITFLLSDDVSITGIDIEEAGRDPTAAGFVPSKAPGHNAFHFSGCNAPQLTDVSIRWAGNGIEAEASNNQPTRPGTLTRVRLNEIWWHDQSTQGQGVFLCGQNGWVLVHCDFDEVGWHHLVPGSATMFRHGIYSKNIPGLSGPYTARCCTFRRCASSGPSADTGCELDHCTIWDCSNVPANQPGGGAYQAWGGGDYSQLHHCTIFGTGNGLLLNALKGDVHDNTIFWDGQHSPLGIDLQAGGAMQQRDANCSVSVRDNLVIVPAGAAIPANVVSIGKGGPAVVCQNNRTVLA